MCVEAIAAVTSSTPTPRAPAHPDPLPYYSRAIHCATLYTAILYIYSCRYNGLFLYLWRRIHRLYPRFSLIPNPLPLEDTGFTGSHIPSNVRMVVVAFFNQFPTLFSNVITNLFYISLHDKSITKMTP